MYSTVTVSKPADAPPSPTRPRASTGSSAVWKPPTTETNYAVLQFNRGEDQSQAGQLPPPVPASAPPLPASSSALAGMRQESAREEVYGNAASIISSVLVPRQAVELQDRIDGGQFGDVYKGSVLLARDRVTAAIKVVRLDNQDPAARKSFLEEMSTMAQLQHRNVVRLLAIVEEPLWLVMEFVNEGTILSYVRAHLSIPLPVLLQVASNVASGLRYLHDHKVLHRDVAAR